MATIIILCSIKVYQNYRNSFKTDDEDDDDDHDHDRLVGRRERRVRSRSWSWEIPDIKRGYMGSSLNQVMRATQCHY